MATYNLFINSKNRDKNQDSHEFSLYLKNQIIVNPNQYISVNVMSFFMLNSMYNVSSIIGNNSFILEKRNLLTNAIESSQTLTIPDGNYSVLTFRDLLNTLLANTISVVYNYGQNTYTFTKLNQLYKYHIIPSKCSKLLGLYDTIEITEIGITSAYVNMVNYQQIILKTDLTHEDLNQDNISDIYDDLNISDILFWCNKQDVEPFKMISYRNEDGGNSFSYNLITDNIQKITFKLVNENNEPITDTPEWLIHLSFIINEKYQYTMFDLAKKIIKLLNDINFTLLNILFKK